MAFTRSLHSFRCRTQLLGWPMPNLMGPMLLGSLFVLASGWAIAFAQVTTNITGDGTLGTAVSQNGNIHDITGGTRPGSGTNLFHSFGEFSVGEGNIANFQNDSGLPTSNILGRVTGGNTSNVFGTIQTTGFGNANLFLTNPAGWVFGPNAALNVAGSVNFTTADYLKHSDGAQFTALPSDQDSQLSVAAISAFGFLDASPTGIVVDGSTLSVNEGHSISLVSGEITMTGGSLKAPSGEIKIASVTSPGQVNLTTSSGTSGFQVDSFASLGSVALSYGATLDASGASGGTVVIRSGQLVMENAITKASSVAQGEAGGIVHLLGEEITLAGSTAITASGDAAGGTILVGGNLHGEGPVPNAQRTHVGPDATISADALTNGDGGEVIVWADGITEFYGDISARGGVEGGNGGFVETSGKQVLHAWGLVDVSAANGSGGTWLLDPANVTIQSAAGSIDGTGNPFTGTTADSTVSDAAIETALNSGGGVNVIISTDTDLGPGNQDGNIVQNADATIEKTQGTEATLTLNAANNIELNGGIESTSDVLHVMLTANDSAQTAHDPNANAGNITINAQILTNGGSFTSKAVGFTSTANGMITTTPNSGGIDSGAVTIEATGGILMDGSRIETSSQGTDTPGKVTITAENMTMTNATIEANTVDADVAETIIDIDLTDDLSIETDLDPAILARTTGSGDAGDIQIASQNMGVLTPEGSSFEGPVIASVTSGTGQGGDIHITTGNLEVIGDIDGFAFFVDSGTAGEGSGGNVSITADSFTMEDAFINTGDNFDFDPFDPLGPAGDVTIETDNLDFTFADIFTESFGGEGGNVTIEGEDVHLDNSNIFATGFEGGGEIIMTVENLIAIDSQIESANLAGAIEPGQGGGITVTANVVELTDGSQFITSTGSNIDAGPIQVSATDRVALLGNTGGRTPSGIFSNSFGVNGTTGKGGAISITTPLLEMTDGGRINTATSSGGLGGSVTIDADSVVISGQQPLAPTGIFGLGNSPASGIYTSTLGDTTTCGGTCGNAGEITITTGSLTMQDGAQMDSGTSSTGDGGIISVDATENISISGTLDDGTPGGIFSRTIGSDSSSGKGGDISITTEQNFSLNNGAEISASSTGPGDSGTVSITADGNVQTSNGTIATSATVAEGGDIEVTAGQNFQLTNNSTVAAESSGPGNSGAVTLTRDRGELSKCGQYGLHVGPARNGWEYRDHCRAKCPIGQQYHHLG